MSHTPSSGSRMEADSQRNYYEKIGFRVLKSGLFDVYGYDKRVPFWCFKVPLPTE